MVTDLLVWILLTRPLGHGPIERVLQALEAGLEGVESIPVIRVRDYLAWSVDVVSVVDVVMMRMYRTRGCDGVWYWV